MASAKHQPWPKEKFPWIVCTWHFSTYHFISGVLLFAWPAQKWGLYNKLLVLKYRFIALSYIWTMFILIQTGPWINPWKNPSLTYHQPTDKIQIIMRTSHTELFHFSLQGSKQNAQLQVIYMIFYQSVNYLWILCLKME